MNCKKCGSPLAVGEQFCRNCGTPVDVAQVSQNNVISGGVIASSNGSVTPEVSNINGNVVSSSVPLGTPSINGSVVNTSTVPGTFNMNSNGMGIGNVPTSSIPTPIMNNNNNNQNNSNKNNIMIIVIVAILVVVIGLAIIFVPKLFNGSEKNNSNNNNNSNVNQGGNSNQTTPVSTSYYKISYAGFTLNIPDDMIYEFSDSSLFIADESETTVAEFLIADGSFSQLVSKKSQLQSNLQKQGYSVQAPEVQTLGGTEYLTLEGSMNGQNILFAYAKLNSTKIATIVVYNHVNDYDYSMLEKISSVISTATYSGTSHSISTALDFSAIADTASGLAK